MVRSLPGGFYRQFLPVGASPAPGSGHLPTPAYRAPEAVSAPQDTLQPRPGRERLESWPRVISGESLNLSFPFGLSSYSQLSARTPPLRLTCRMGSLPSEAAQVSTQSHRATASSALLSILHLAPGAEPSSRARTLSRSLAREEVTQAVCAQRLRTWESAGHRRPRLQPRLQRCPRTPVSQVIPAAGRNLSCQVAPGAIEANTTYTLGVPRTQCRARALAKP